MSSSSESHGTHDLNAHPQDSSEVVARLDGWALVKRGLYWRPDGKGYTGLKCEAGFYTDDQASGYSDHDDGTTKVRWADAPELSPSCSTETALKHFTSRALTAERLLAEARAERTAALVEIEAAKAFGGGYFGPIPSEATREIYREQARATLSKGGMNGQ